MPSKKLATETAAATPKRAAKPKTPKTEKPAIAVKSATPRVRAARHKVVSVAAVRVMNAHEEISKLAYSFWEARGRQHGFHEQDWLRAEQEYLLTA
ncbi:MAG TPA: DUF2934 domain-containing protein [Bryobacteraceae bacterium]|nr:DUF2934 domain-containing protein [Bryobacteraceae bacterium]